MNSEEKNILILKGLTNCFFDNTQIGWQILKRYLLFIEIIGAKVLDD